MIEILLVIPKPLTKMTFNTRVGKVNEAYSNFKKYYKKTEMTIDKIYPRNVLYGQGQND